MKKENMDHMHEDILANITQQINYINANIKVLLVGLEAEENNLLTKEHVVNFLIPVEERIDDILNELKSLRSGIE